MNFWIWIFEFWKKTALRPAHSFSTPTGSNIDKCQVKHTWNDQWKWNNLKYLEELVKKKKEEEQCEKTQWTVEIMKKINF